MRKFPILILAVCVLSCLPSIAEDDGMWDSYNVNIPNYGEQRYVGDDEFNEAIEKLNKQDKVKKWMKRLQGTNLPKGTQFTQANESEEINRTSGDKADLPVLSLPVEISAGDGIIPVGHYQIKGENNNGRAYLSLYQAHELIAKIPATITEEDFDKEELLFADWVSLNDEEIKIIYGSLDFNAFAILKIK
jgi:hypothetical protein